MPEAERTLKFVVVGHAPRALAIPATAVRNVLADRDFAGPALDLRELGGGQTDAGDRVLEVGLRSPPVRLRVRGGLELMTVREKEVLPLPTVVARPAWLSHLIAPQGVPLVFVLDLARIAESGTTGCPLAADSVEPET
jgi:hypothetical protein